MKHPALKSEDFRRNGKLVKYPALKMNTDSYEYSNC